VSYRMIQVLGRWGPDAVRQYLYCSPDELWAASGQMLDSCRCVGLGRLGSGFRELTTENSTDHG